MASNIYYMLLKPFLPSNESNFYNWSGQSCRTLFCCKEKAGLWKLLPLGWQLTATLFKYLARQLIRDRHNPRRGFSIRCLKFFSFQDLWHFHFLCFGKTSTKRRANFMRMWQLLSHVRKKNVKEKLKVTRVDLLVSSPNLCWSGQKLREFPEVECRQNLINGLIKGLPVDGYYGNHKVRILSVQMLGTGVKLHFWQNSPLSKSGAEEYGEVSKTGNFCLQRKL